MRKFLLFLTVVLVALAVPASAIENGFFLGGSIGGSSVEVRDFDDEFGDVRFSGDGTAVQAFRGLSLSEFPRG